uniref:MADS-box domain-containing protein n=1 Tax=Solanum lycopersicum TaxID=4081 RepID=A0A3Q7EMD6_SOLLC
MENKKSRGRQKIPMKKIEKLGDLYASFSKRRLSLYKKASDLVFECDVDIGMIYFSPKGNPYSFFHPNVNTVVSRFQNPDMEFSESDLLITTDNQVKVKELKSRLDELDIIEDIAIATKKSYDEVIKARKRGWWESIEQLNEPQVTKFEAWMDTIIFNMQNRLNEMENGASSS